MQFLSGCAELILSCLLLISLGMSGRTHREIPEGR